MSTPLRRRFRQAPWEASEALGTTDVPPEPVVSARGVRFRFADQPDVVAGVDLGVRAGEHVGIVGSSGSGKSTLLQLLAGVLAPRAGEVRFDGAPFGSLSQDERAAIRLTSIGMVFQFAELVPELTLAENVELPLRILTRRLGRTERRRVGEALARLGIDHVADHLPGQVSGGERRRAAIARAAVHRPRLILADEPTGALDGVNGHRILDFLLETATDLGAALVVVTHEPYVAERMTRRVAMRDGVLAPS